MLTYPILWMQNQNRLQLLKFTFVSFNQSHIWSITELNARGLAGRVLDHSPLLWSGGRRDSSVVELVLDNHLSAVASLRFLYASARKIYLRTQRHT